jgi:D-sedoheptulose 7-phosphate isomerase
MYTVEDVRSRIEESIRVKQALLKEAPLLLDLARLWSQVIERGNQVIFFGNGGSAADAQHLVCELAGRFYLERRAVAAISLTVNTSSLTAIGNDYGYEQIFSRQLEGIARPGDAAVGISTSGNSPNVLLAVEKAHTMGLTTIGFTGRKGGQLRERCHYWLGIDSEETPRIQEGHILAGHIICELTEKTLFGK